MASSCFAAERTRSGVVRASSIRGASISFEGGGSAGTVQDVVLDPNTGCARFVLIQTGGRTVAAPYQILHSTGSGSYTVTVDRERLVSAPVVNEENIEEFASPEFTQQIYGYYGVNPSEINVSEGRGERGISGGRAIREGRGAMEQGTERGETAGRAGERGAVQGSPSPSRAQSGQSPAPVGEAAGRQHRARQHATPGSAGKPSPAGAESRQSPAPVRERTGTQREQGEAASPSPSRGEHEKSTQQERSRSQEHRSSAMPREIRPPSE